MRLLTHNERVDEIRFLLGDVPVTLISDTAISRFVEQEEDYYGDLLENQCYVIYNALLKCLLWLMNKGTISAAGVVGEVTSIKEKKGPIEKEVRFANNIDASKTSTWKGLYDYYKKNPELICKSLKRNLAGLVKVGGVSRKDKNEIYSNPDNFGAGYSENQDARDYNYNQYSRVQDDPYYFPTDE